MNKYEIKTKQNKTNKNKNEMNKLFSSKYDADDKAETVKISAKKIKKRQTIN